MDGFADYYNRVYNLLKIQSIKITQGEKVITQDRCVYTYVANMHSDEYGDFSFEMQLQVLSKMKFYLVEWTPANVVPQMQWNDQIFMSTVKAKRGEIFDCEGKVLVRNSFAITVYAVTDDVKDSVSSTASSVSKILNIKAADVLDKINKAITGQQDTAVLDALLPGELTQAQENSLDQIKGIKIDRDSITPIRYYPNGDVATQVLGYSSPVTPDDRQDPKYANLPEGTRVGRAGIEKAYDTQLQGTDGFEVYLISDTKARKDVLYTKPAIDGKSITLTLDIVLQAGIQKEMTTLYANKCSGSIVILTPTTGAVAAMASYPFYDANLYAFNTARDGAQALYTTDSGSPTLNRAIQGLYPPGSIFKSVTALIGLETQSVTTSTVFPYANQIEYLDADKDRWRPAGSNWSDYIVRQAFRSVPEASKGVMDMNRGLIWSDNIYFGWLAMKIGKDNFIKYAKEFGVGESIPFDLPVKASNIANDLTSFNSQKFLADSGFGQAELLFTPLQLACTYSQYGNNGSIMQPYILQSFDTTDDKGNLVPSEVTQPKLYKKVASGDNILKVRNIMEHTAKDGTGKSGTIGLPADMRVCAKTGTAQTGNNINEIGWYAAYIISGGLNRTVLVNVDGPVGGDTALKFKMVNYILKELEDKPAPTATAKP